MVAAIFVLALTAAVGGASASTSSQADTSLKISYWENGRLSTEPVTWTLACSPARGTLKNPGVACTRLAAGGWVLFTPVPRQQICTQIYGGPQVARVIGVVEGRRVWASFNRVNGCSISRWNRLSPWLLPRGGVSS